jgi:glycosyltransferase involved in cell wall biosynthesis
VIYLDVTSACRSPLNTGVKRIQRGLHGFLRARNDYQPVCWHARWRLYRSLTRREQETLEQKRIPSGLELFDRASSGSWRDWLPLRESFSRPIAFRSGDLLFLPDLLWDNRSRHLPRGASPGLRRIGVFHDAIALRQPRQSRLDAHLSRRSLPAWAALDGVLCVSQEAEADLHHFWQKEHIPPAPTRVAPWPVPFAGPRPAAPPNFAARRILCVARLEPHKNHLRLLQACRELWRLGIRFQLDLIGCFAYPGAAWKILRRVRALRRMGVPVEWRAHVEEAVLHAAYGASSFNVFPSLLEGFGLPILESLWHGRPVVCGGNGALGELAREGGCVPVDTLSVSSLAEGMRTLLTDESSYAALVAAAQRRRFRSWADYWNEISGFCNRPGN